MRDVISVTEIGGKLCPKRSKGSSKLQCKEVADRSEEEGDDVTVLVKPSPRMQKTSLNPETRATANTKNVPMCGGG